MRRKPSNELPEQPPSVSLWTEQVFARSVTRNGTIRDIPGARVEIPEGRSFNFHVPFLYAQRTKIFTLPNPKTARYDIPTEMTLMVQSRTLLGLCEVVRYELRF